MKIQVFTTGGTIDKVYFDALSEYQVGGPQVQEVFKEANVTFEFGLESILRKDSLELTDADRRLIRERVAACPFSHILITHGTDTMVDTARTLLDIPGKTIVLTGSIQPAQFRNTDAVFNIGTAVGAVQSLGPGVYIAMNGRVLDARRARKDRARRCFVEESSAT